MAITRITIENFKGIAERVEIDLKPITVLFGANSAGKSTLLQALLYLREILERRNADADQLQASGSSIDLGGFQSLVHEHDRDREVKIGVTIDIGADGLPTVPVAEILSHESERSRDFLENGITTAQSATVEILIGFNKSFDSPEIRRYSVSIDEVHFATLEAESEQQCFLVSCNTEHPTLFNEFAQELDDEESPVELLALGNYLQESDTRLHALEFIEGHRVPIFSRSVIPAWGKQILPPFSGDVSWKPESDEDGFEEYQNYAFAQFLLSHLLVGAGEAVLNELKGICYIGPWRAVPERNFSPMRSPREDRWADGMAAWDKLHHSAMDPDGGGLVSATSEWISDHLKLGYTLYRRKYYEVDHEGLAHLALMQLQEDAYDADVESAVTSILRDFENSPHKTEISLNDTKTGAQVAPCDIGVGVSQVIPVIVSALAGDGNLIAIEQPELHLHPAIQSRIADLFLYAALEAANKSFILESHSEHLMLRLLRRIRETYEEGEADVEYLGAIRPSDISVYYVNATDTETEMIHLRVSEEGDFLDRWPNGFFEERREELF